MILIFAIFFLIPINLFGDISISASVSNNTVSLNEQITMQVTISGDVNNLPSPKLPEMPDFQVYSSGRSQNVSIINGQVSSSLVFSYILAPRKVGEFVINPISIEYKGKTYQTEPISIKVVKSASAGQMQYEKDVYRGESRGIFVEAVVDKRKVYVNEQITFTFRFFTKLNIISQPQYQPPDTTGFVVEDLPPQRNFYTTINGERYYVSEIKTALFPISSGKYTIGSAILRCMVEDFSFDNFFGDNFFKNFFSSGKELVLKTNPIEITVLPLPQPQPKDFNGSVGDYKMSINLDKNTVEINNTVMLDIEIAGSGNVRSVTFPKNLLESYLGNNFVIFEPITSFDTKKENYIVSGRKVFKVPISPTVQGNISIPPIKFVFFNPKTNNYETLISKTLNLSVLPSKVMAPIGNSQSNPVKDNILKQKKLQLEDIRYIKLKLNINKKKNYNLFMIWFLQFIPIILYLGFYSLNLYKKSTSKDVRKLRYTTAFRKFKKRINNFRKKYKNFETKQLLTDIYDMFSEYFADKMNITKEAITLNDVKEYYSEKISKDLLDQIVNVWEELNFYQFATSRLDELNINELLNRIDNIIVKLEYER